MQAAPNQAIHKPASQPVSFGSWMLTLFLMMIPLVNLIMLFVWAFGGSNPSKANYAKATLMWALIGIVIYIILIVLGISAEFSRLND
ncbi:hypothetical protein HUB98_00700 [Paenibacillus barcinonensis]|uniref:Uncharacterized protein n=1 Tax=Paenibacillus barcinonensis TaxID=198119 RepID=A0A2V4VLN9_PAEBA|nr:hypothetical protein [Paenibacillus barcinonensis]PYE50295.1 hypothetical protein DFQ00_104254 [Paenibacillus barcinonensis]QKS54976.1 hypothetical protein HUB98_00700 [Paenibacillus barcinonensis]